jgi:hypothetical protein
MRSNLLSLLVGAALLTGASAGHKGHHGKYNKLSRKSFQGKPLRSSTGSMPNDVWPAPVSFTKGSGYALLDPSFSIACAGSCPEPLPSAFKRYSNILTFAGQPAAVPAGTNAITALKVVVDGDYPLSLHVAENYTLIVPVNGVATLTVSSWIFRSVRDTAGQGRSDEGQARLTPLP